MNTPTTVPSQDALQAWSNNPDAALVNLRSIFSSLKLDSSMAEWAVEALEHCGVPQAADYEFLAKLTADHQGDVAYWACKLIGRVGDKANNFQKELGAALISEQATLATRQQAALSLSLLGTLTEATRNVLRQSSQSTDPRLARISTQALGSDP